MPIFFLVFYASRSILRKEIGSIKNADIASLLFLKVKKSKYFDNNGNRFFLLPNIQYLSEQTGYGEKSCQTALSFLNKNDWIKKIKKRCFDGGVRSKIYITDKLSNIMTHIESTQTKNPDYAFKHTIRESKLIQQSKTKKNTQINTKKQTIINHKPITNVLNKKETIHYIFSLDYKQYNEKTENFVRDLAKQENLNPSDLFETLCEFQESQLYNNQEAMISDAIRTLQRIKNRIDILPKCNIQVNLKKIILKSEDYRKNYLTPLQQIAIIQTLKSLNKKNKAIIGSIKEVFSWIEFQVTNYEHHFQGKKFKHCLNIIKKMLCYSGNNQYSKPHGYNSAYNEKNNKKMPLKPQEFYMNDPLSFHNTDSVKIGKSYIKKLNIEINKYNKYLDLKYIRKNKDDQQPVNVIYNSSKKYFLTKIGKNDDEIAYLNSQKIYKHDPLLCHKIYSVKTRECDKDSF